LSTLTVASVLLLTIEQQLRGLMLMPCQQHALLMQKTILH